MGNPSSLRFIPASSSTAPIDWTRIPEKAKRVLIKCYRRDEEDFPTTIGDLAEMFDETKFFGHFNPDIVVVLMDISEFGLQPTPTNGAERPVGPRFYMTYTDEVWFLLFTPGTTKCIMGRSGNLIRNYDDDDDDDEACKKMEADGAIAQAFDVQLEREVSQGREDMVESPKKLGGWTVWTVLPPSHPAACFAYCH